MTRSPLDESAETILDTISGTRDALTVGKVFGDPYELEGLTVIPVARVSGGGGGGGGESDDDQGGGFGAGFRLSAQPVGVYQVRDDEVVWKPSIDVTRLARGGQALVGTLLVCLTLVFLRRRR